MNRQNRLLPYFVLVSMAICCTAAPGQDVRSNPPLNTPSRGNQAQDDHIGQWFSQYDKIRRQAQMNPDERQRADALLSKGISMMVPGPEKVAAGQLLFKLAKSNQDAATQMKGLRDFPETDKLHRGFYQYFNDAQNLFNDYLKVQNNLFAAGPDGKPIMGQLMARKQQLEVLDQSNKALDSQLRAQYGIPPYHF